MEDDDRANLSQEASDMKDVLENPANDHDFVLNTLREFFVTEAYNDRQGYDWLLSSILGSHQSSMEYLISKTLLTAHQRFSALNSCVGRNEVTMALYWFKVKGVGWVSPDGTRNCLETAIRRKFYEMIEAILMNEGPVGWISPKRESLLHIVLYETDIKALSLIIDKPEALQNVKDHRDARGKTPAALAVHLGHPRALELILSLKPDLSLERRDGETPLHTACNKNRPDLIQLLLKAGASQDDVDGKGSRPMSIAAFKGSLTVCNLLWAAKPANKKILEQDQEGETPHWSALRRNDLDLFMGLLRMHYNPGTTNIRGETLLYSAVNKGAVDFVEALLNVPPRQRGEIDKVLTVYRSIYIPSEIPEPQAGPSTRSPPRVRLTVGRKSYSETVLMRAVSLNFEPIVNLLLTKGAASTTILNEDGRSALMFAIMHGWVELIPILFNHAAAVIQEDKEGVNCMALAVKTMSIDIVKAVFDRRPNMDLVDRHEGTPLHYAVRRSSPEIVKILLAKGANPRLSNDRGVSAYELAHGLKQAEILKIFERQEVAKAKRAARKRTRDVSAGSRTSEEGESE